MQQTFQIHFMAKFLEKRHILSPHIWGKKFIDLFNPIQDEVLFAPPTPPPPTSFSLATSTNIRISPQNLLTFCHIIVKFQVCT